MEYQTFDMLDFTPNDNVNSKETNFDALLSTMNPEDFYNWLSPNQQELSPPQPIELQISDSLTVVPPETWSDSMIIKTEPNDIVEMIENVPKNSLKRESNKTRKSGSKRVKPNNTGEEDEKYLRRLEANKLSAQASRERKKQLKSILEIKVNDLSEENKILSKEMTQLETENKVLKAEFIQLQNLIFQSPILGKLMAQQLSMNLPSVEEMEKKKLKQSNQIPLFTPSASTDPASFMYLLVVLQTFSHYFNNSATNITNPTKFSFPSFLPSNPSITAM